MKQVSVTAISTLLATFIFLLVLPAPIKSAFASNSSKAFYIHFDEAKIRVLPAGQQTIHGVNRFLSEPTVYPQIQLDRFGRGFNYRWEVNQLTPELLHARRMPWEGLYWKIDLNNEKLFAVRGGEFGFTGGTETEIAGTSFSKRKDAENEYLIAVPAYFKADPGLNEAMIYFAGTPVLDKKDVEVLEIGPDLYHIVLLKSKDRLWLADVSSGRLYVVEDGQFGVKDSGRKTLIYRAFVSKQPLSAADEFKEVQPKETYSMRVTDTEKKSGIDHASTKKSSKDVVRVRAAAPKALPTSSSEIDIGIFEDALRSLLTKEGSTKQDSKSRDCRALEEINTPSIMTSDRHIPFDNYYDSFTFIRATENALLLGFVDPEHWDKAFYIANLKNGRLTQLPLNLMSDVPYQVIPSINISDNGRQLSIDSSFIEGFFVGEVRIKLISIQFDLLWNVIESVNKGIKTISIRDPENYLLPVIEPSSRNVYWSDGDRFIATYTRGDNDDAPLQIVFGREDGTVFNVEVAAPEEALLRDIYNEKYGQFCGYNVKNGAMHDDKFVFGLEFYSGEGCRGIGGIGTLNFDRGTLDLRKSDTLQKFSVEKVLSLGTDSIFVVPIWGGEGWAGRWTGPWVYGPMEDMWRQFPYIRNYEVLLDADVSNRDLWVAGDRKLYRFDIPGGSKSIYGLARDKKSLTPINSATITSALKGTVEDQKWGFFWLSEEPPKELTQLVLDNLDNHVWLTETLRAVGKGKIYEALPRLLEMKLDNGTAPYHVLALYSLGGSEAKDKIESLCRESPHYCDSSIDALSCMKDGTESLIRLLNTNEPTVATAIVSTLGNMGAIEAVPDMLRFAEVVNYLKATVKSERSPAYQWQHTYERLIDTFAELKDKRAVPWLKKEMQQTSESDYELQNELLDAIVSISGKDAVEYLKELRDEERHPPRVIDRINKHLEGLQ